jgi:hypothetical protein
MSDKALFTALVFSLHAAGMQQLGKVVNPMTGKVERDLEQAKGTVDMMEMLKRKTEGNLEEEEQKLLSHFLYELQMNYIDEVKSGEKTGTGNTEEGKKSEADEGENA